VNGVELLEQEMRRMQEQRDRYKTGSVLWKRFDEARVKYGDLIATLNGISRRLIKAKE
jgi:hypothetical protein